MKTSRLFLVLLLFAPLTAAQPVQQCVCVAGCKIASAPMLDPVHGAPTSCTIYQMPARTQLAAGATVDATTASGGIPVGNSLACLPADANYIYGPTGSRACLVMIPPQPAGSTLTYVATFTYGAAGESGDSTPDTFQSVQTLPKPSVPVGLRVVP